MSVDAINGANAQQQPQKHSALPGAIAGGVGLGAAGALGGYFLGGKRPTLEQVFKQDPDTFKSEAVTKKDAEAAKTLQDAVEECRNAGDAEAKTWLNAQHEVGEAIVGQNVEKKAELEDTINKAQQKLNEKKVKIGDTEYTHAKVKEEFKKAKEALRNATDDTKAAKEADVKAAYDKVKAFNEGAKEEMKTLNDAKKALRNAQKTAFEEAAKVADSEAAKKATAATEARTKFTNAKSAKLTETLAKDEIKQAFEKIKDAIPKEGKGKMAMIAGGIAAAVGLVAGYLMNSGHNDQA